MFCVVMDSLSTFLPISYAYCYDWFIKFYYYYLLAQKLLFNCYLYMCHVKYSIFCTLDTYIGPWSYLYSQFRNKTTSDFQTELVIAQ